MTGKVTNPLNLLWFKTTCKLSVLPTTHWFFSWAQAHYSQAPKYLLIKLGKSNKILPDLNLSSLRYFETTLREL